MLELNRQINKASYLQKNPIKTYQTQIQSFPNNVPPETVEIQGVTYIRSDLVLKSKKKEALPAKETRHSNNQAVESIKDKEHIKMMMNYFYQKKQYRNLLLFTLGITTAYRCGDLLTLKFNNLLNSDGAYKYEIDLYEQKTGKRRKMEITEPIKNAMNLYINSLSSFELDEYIFTGRDNRGGEGTPLGVRAVGNIFKKAGKELGLVQYNIASHTMRKTYAYWYLQTHKNDITALATLQDIFNHSSEKITLNYCGISKEEIKNNNRNVSNEWNNLLKEVVSLEDSIKTVEVL